MLTLNFIYTIVSGKSKKSVYKQQPFNKQKKLFFQVIVKKKKINKCYLAIIWENV